MLYQSKEEKWEPQGVRKDSRSAIKTKAELLFNNFIDKNGLKLEVKTVIEGNTTTIPVFEDEFKKKELVLVPVMMKYEDFYKKNGEIFLCSAFGLDYRKYNTVKNTSQGIKYKVPIEDLDILFSVKIPSKNENAGIFKDQSLMRKLAELNNKMDILKESNEKDLDLTEEEKKDENISKLTIRDLTAIIRGIPCSNKSWLNEIIVGNNNNK